MALYIRDDKVRELAAQIAERQGVTVTEAVRAALLEVQHRLERDRARRDAEARKVLLKLRAMREKPLREEVLYDESGNPLTSNFADYGVISMTELPSYELIPLETPTTNNPLGAKGIGESGAIGATPALQSAVVDALSHLGIRHLDIPASPQRVWAAIAEAQAGRS